MINEIIDRALQEDIGEGDHSTLSCVPENATGKAELIIKEDGILAGVELALMIFHRFDPALEIQVFLKDGQQVKKGEIAFVVKGSSRSILSTERLVLNFMQRMSGIATQTNKIVQLISGTNTKLLDTRKTTPGIRYMEKWAVRIGGGYNHRFALYDMIMLKDNHIDYAGGIGPAIDRANDYLFKNELDLKIEIEVREVLPLIPEKYETEASGGITLETIRSYAETGIQFISVGALTHSVKSLDMSLKAKFDYSQSSICNL